MNAAPPCPARVSLPLLALLLPLLAACGGGAPGAPAGPTGLARPSGAVEPPLPVSVTPPGGTTLGGRLVAIAGSSFSASPADPTVTFGGAPATVVSATATLITVTSPAGLSGPADVKVTNPDGQFATLAAAYQYLAPPELQSLSPTSGATGGGELVTLAGAGFSTTPAPLVTLDGTPVPVTAGHTATSLTITTPAHGAGAVTVTVTNPDGQLSSLPAGFTYLAPAGAAPTVQSVLDDLTGLPSGPAGGGRAVTLTGTHFAPGATVQFGAAPATSVAWISTTTLTARTPLAQLAGPVDVTVALPGTGLAGTLPRGFTFLDAAPVVPALGTIGSPAAGGGLLLLQGSGLHASTVVTVGGVTAAFDAFTPGLAGAQDQLVVIIPPSPLLPAVADGFVEVVLHNPDGQTAVPPRPFSSDGTEWPANLHFGPPPSVSGFTPTSGKGIDVTITGSDFSADAAGPRVGLQVLLSGPSPGPLAVHRCPVPAGAQADPFCTPGLVTPTPTSLVVSLPSSKLNPGDYTFIVSDFDGQSTRASGVFVVP